MKAETCRVSVCRCEGTRVPGPPCSTRWTQKAVTWFSSDIVNNVNIYLSTFVSRLFWMTESSAAATGGTYSSALPCLALTSLILQLCVCSAFRSAACYPAMLSMLFHAPLYSPWLAMTCHDCPCLVTRTALELQSVHLGLLSKADYCTILYSAHEYIEQLYITIYIIYEIIWTTWKAHAVVFLWYFDPQRTSCTSEGYLGYKWLQSVLPANSGRGLTSHTRNCTYVESVFGSFDAFERFRTLSEGASKNNTC